MLSKIVVLTILTTEKKNSMWKTEREGRGVLMFIERLFSSEDNQGFPGCFGYSLKTNIVRTENGCPLKTSTFRTRGFPSFSDSQPLVFCPKTTSSQFAP